MRRHSLLALAAASLLALTSAGALEVLEEAVETEVLDIRLTSASSGRVVTPLCAGCEPESLIITRDSRAWLGNELIPMRQLKHHAAQGATVLYDAETRIVTRILIWQ